MYQIKYEDFERWKGWNMFIMVESSGAHQSYSRIQIILFAMILSSTLTREAWPCMWELGDSVSIIQIGSLILLDIGGF